MSDFSYLLLLSGIVFSIVHFFKLLILQPAAKSFALTPEQYRISITLFAVAVGEGIVFLASEGETNLFIYVPALNNWPPMIGRIATGVLIALGNGGLHWFFDTMRALQPLLNGLAAFLNSLGDRVPPVDSGPN